MATITELDAQWEAQYQVVLEQRKALTSAQTAVATSPAYQNGTEAERAELSRTGGVEAARLAFNAENQKLTAIANELNALKRQAAADEAAAAAQAEAEKPESTIKSPEATNESETDKDTAAKYADPTRVPNIGSDFDAGNAPIGANGQPMRAVPLDPEDGGPTAGGVPIGSTKPGFNRLTGQPKIPDGAQAPTPTPASAQWAGAKDLRVFLRAPLSYMTGPMTRPLTEFGGILFPYTPVVSYDNQASYGSVNPIHSNYTQYFFKNSSVGNISVTGKLTVQNEKEAIIWLSIQHLLRALTKMRWGKDVDAGSPPPVCRLEGYGDFMLRNVPVVVSQFKIDYPDNVDYIAVNTGVFKTSLVPTISSLSLTLNPSYSRKELQDFSVDSWLSGGLKGKGYL